MKVIEVDINHPYPGDKHKRHHMVIMHQYVEEAAKQLNLNIGDTFYILQFPDRSNKFFKTTVGEDYIREYIENRIKDDEVWGSTIAGVGEGFKRAFGAQGYSNWWIENGNLIKQYHVVPGY